ncbi:DUF4326 domain-containing protein [Hyphomicrobium sp. MC1]|uniref:DUF4326 domain-containing protein n=1 Tax=Hyphomicrobium sp. (strain MC1) TaxID=717785 RepID=UPI000213DA87|nr:DUF4326 domain-containing protein [Hyphomicrobium sp. MC1]CCB64428.1 conserved protein of unknown function [Hyphomicrobium sp. MC1]
MSRDEVKPETESPRRIQLKRTKGWKMPPNTVKVTRPGKWGNQFKVGDKFLMVDDDGARLKEYVCASDAEAVYCYKNYINSQFGMDLLDDAQKELRGKNLACWCRPGAPCHADVLLEIANADDTP